MGYGTDIQAKLGVDTSSVGTDLAGAKNQFNKWGQDVASTGAGHGANFGDKFTGALEHKLVGSRHLAGAVAVALGLNIEKIAEHIAEAITGGSAEAWAEVGKLEDEHFKLLKEKWHDAMSPKQLGQSLEKELEEAQKKLDSIKGDKVYGGEDVNGGAVYKEAALNAAQSKARSEALVEIDRIEKQIREQHKEDAKDVKEYGNERKKISLEELSDGQKYEELNQRIADTVLEIAKGDLSAGEQAKKKIELLRMEHDLKLTIKKIGQEDAKLIKDSDEAEIKRAKEKIELAQKKHNVELAKEKLTADINKQADLGKLTIGELANVQGKHADRTFISDEQMAKDRANGIDEGLDPNILAAKKQAQQIQALEAEAEQKRLAGDSGGYKTAFDKAGQLTKDLADSGKIKMSESDKFTEIAKQIKEDNITLNKSVQELVVIEKGKFVSQ